jgi:hypothetical protein
MQKGHCSLDWANVLLQCQCRYCIGTNCGECDIHDVLYVLYSVIGHLLEKNQ